MSPQAEQLKKQTLERYEYCVADRVRGFEERLREAEQKPDEYWEKQAQKA
jgi:hypothetical protein